MRETIFNLDHVVIVVPNLPNALERYKALGFTVSLGGSNGPTHNALIPFQDGTYIELISMRSEWSRRVFGFLFRTNFIYALKPFVSNLSFRFICWIGGPSGIRDWCFLDQHSESFADVIDASGIEMSNVEKFTRIKPDQQRVEWLLAAPMDQSLPFFIRDISDRSLRVPRGPAANHNNGCQGISRLLLNETLYFSSKQKLTLLHSQMGMPTKGSQHTTVDLVSGIQGRIAVELSGLGCSAKILEMHNCESPTIR